MAAALLGVAFSWLGYYSGAGIHRFPEDRICPARARSDSRGWFRFLFVQGRTCRGRLCDEAGGYRRRVAKVRVNALKSLEHAPIAVGTCIASIFLLASVERAAHRSTSAGPGQSAQYPVAPSPSPCGGYRKRLWDQKGQVKQALGIALDGIWLLREMAIGGKSRGLPFFGMTLFWGADIFALWAALEAFSGGISFAGIILGYAVGYVLTRRSAPLGGAGLIDLILPPCLGPVGHRLPERSPRSRCIASSVCGYHFLQRSRTCQPCEPSARPRRRIVSRRWPNAAPGRRRWWACSGCAADRFRHHSAVIRSAVSSARFQRRELEPAARSRRGSAALPRSACRRGREAPNRGTACPDRPGMCRRNP